MHKYNIIALHSVVNANCVISGTVISVASRPRAAACISLCIRTSFIYAVLMNGAGRAPRCDSTRGKLYKFDYFFESFYFKNVFEYLILSNEFEEIGTVTLTYSRRVKIE